MTRYINTKTQYGVETLDEVTKTDQQTRMEFKKYLREQVEEFRKNGTYAYISQRCDRSWNA